MTREEAIRLIKRELCPIRCENGNNMDECEARCEFKEAIKALEQEPFINKPCISVGICEHDKNIVLDKIRAEIEEQVLESLSDGGDDWFTAEKVNECLEIIDKYRAEIK